MLRLLALPIRIPQVGQGPAGQIRLPIAYRHEQLPELTVSPLLLLAPIPCI